MNTQRATWSRVAVATSMAVALMTQGAAHAAPGSADPCAPTARTHVDRRVHEAAAAGPESLRRFIARTRMIYALDMPTEVARLDAEQAAIATCAQLSARASATDETDRR
jgi:hypothetical protein